MGAVLIGIEESFLSATRYGSVFGLMHMVWADLLATRPGARKQKQTSARPRSDLGPRTFKQPGQQEKTLSDLPPGLITTLRQGSNDRDSYDSKQPEPAAVGDRHEAQADESPLAGDSPRPQANCW